MVVRDPPDRASDPGSTAAYPWRVTSDGFGKSRRKRAEAFRRCGREFRPSAGGPGRATAAHAHAVATAQVPFACRPVAMAEIPVSAGVRRCQTLGATMVELCSDGLGLVSL